MVSLILNDPIVGEIFKWIGYTWFLWVPIALVFLFWDTWVGYVQMSFITSRKFVMLEVKIPREVTKSPKAMESIFAGIHGTSRAGNMKERYWDGWVTPWFSFEIVADGGEIHFYIWMQAFFKKMIEAQIFAQYPSCEIKEVEDYTKMTPASMPTQDWNMWGTEYVHTKANAYPIRTYEDFALEDISSKEEESKIDPLASLFEFLSHLRPGEKLWIQILVRPAGDAWQKEGAALVGKMAGKTSLPKTNLITQVVDSLHDVFMGIFNFAREEKPSKKDGDQFKIMNLSPGERSTMEAIERNIAKIGFETGIRWMYLAKRDSYNALAIPATFGIFRQFSSASLNGFKPNGNVTPNIDYLFKTYRDNYRKNRLYKAYKMRSIFNPPYKSKTMVLSSSELATIYHFPGMVVSSAAVPRIDTKRGAPPTNLPI